MKAIEFYRQQSTYTNPINYSFLFDDLPQEVALLKEIIQNLIMHFWDENLLGYKIPLARLAEIETRYIAKTLARLYELERQSLLVAREPSKRIVGSCRDYAVLLCSMLRHHKIPARTRVAFSGYYFKEYYHDEVIVEYWNENKTKWCLIDPRVTDIHIKKQKLKIDFDLLDVPREQLLVAGLAWKKSREDQKLANKFCGGRIEQNKGLWYVCDRLIQDFAALNSVEMQLWDGWGLMLNKNVANESDEELVFLDYLAELTLNPDYYFREIRELYQNDSNLRVPKKIYNFNPILGTRQIELMNDNFI